MAIFTKITDLIYRKQKIIEVLAIFLFFSLVLFRFDSEKITLFWSSYPSVAIVLALTTALIAIIWLRIEKRKTQLLINNLQNTMFSPKARLKVRKKHQAAFF